MTMNDVLKQRLCVFFEQVSQVMMGIMVMSYSIPLHVTEFTEVVTLGVPWWSGLMVRIHLISAPTKIFVIIISYVIIIHMNVFVCVCVCVRVVSLSQQVCSPSSWTNTAPLRL